MSKIIKNIEYEKNNTINMDQVTKQIFSNEFIEINNVLGLYMGIGICDENVNSKIAEIDFHKYEQFMNLITSQKFVSSIEPIYSMYKVNLVTHEVSHHIDIAGNIQNMYYTTIQSDDRFLVLNCLCVNSLMTFLLENTKDISKYVFIPAVFGSEVNEIGHFSIIAFDIIEKKVYFIDPNGRSSFFDNIFNIYAQKIKDTTLLSYTSNMSVNTEELLEKLIELYIKNFNSVYGTEYEFVKRLKWNPLQISINKTYDETVIGSGHCVATSTLIANYLSITNKKPNDIINIFNKMNKEEIIQVINSYSVGMYNIIS